MKPKYSPMMMQYLSIKEENQDSIVMFRLGDFYEMFFDDAIMVSKELEMLELLNGFQCVGYLSIRLVDIFKN